MSCPIKYRLNKKPITFIKPEFISIVLSAGADP